METVLLFFFLIITALKEPSPDQDIIVLGTGQTQISIPLY